MLIPYLFQPPDNFTWKESAGICSTLEYQPQLDNFIWQIYVELSSDRPSQQENVFLQCVGSCGKSSLLDWLSRSTWYWDPLHK